MRRKPLLICREANAGTLWLFCPCSYSRSFHSVFEPEEENICAARLFIHSLGVYAIRFEPKWQRCASLLPIEEKLESSTIEPAMVLDSGGNRGESACYISLLFQTMPDFSTEVQDLFW
jgi:hypothetical protein